MYRALLWKEYRDIRLPLSLTALSCTILFWVIIILDMLRISYYEALGGTPFYSSYGFWNLIAILLTTFYTIMAGSESFASEYQTKSFDFLISRAVSREAVWYSKFGLRISTLLFPILYFILFNRFLITDYAGIQYQGIFVASTILLFSTSFFFSTIFNRSIKAGITGMIVYLGYAMLFFHFFDNYIAFTISSIILSIMILIASYVIFTKGKFSYGV